MSSVNGVAPVDVKDKETEDGMVEFSLGDELDLNNPENKTYDPAAVVTPEAHIHSIQLYREMYEKSLKTPAEFWASIADELYFETKQPQSPQLFEYNINCKAGPIHVNFMPESKTNVAYNCLERNIERGLGDTTAFTWVGNCPADEKTYTYNELLKIVIDIAKVLRGNGVAKGDRVAIYLPMVIELPATMLACARIGAVHSVVFAGFSAPSLASRLVDGQCKILVTSDAFARGPKIINLKEIVDDALKLASNLGHTVSKCLVVRHMDRVTMPPGCDKPTCAFNPPMDVYLESAIIEHAGQDDSVEWLLGEDPLFMLYTSGSTGKPKGVVHTQAGYMLYAYATTKYVFDIHTDDVYWCTADCGWITGHSYIVYGPLANGCKNILFEGTPTYPMPNRCWEIVEKYKVSKFYTAPTAIRSLMAFKNELVTQHDRSSLKVLGTVGEPINPAAWLWYYDVVGEKKCAIVDTYWQTETGGHVLTPLPGCTPTKPGSATLPFFGVAPCLLDDEGRLIEGPGSGNLCFSDAWPGMARTVYGDHDRFTSTYFKAFPGYYFTGDGARRDADGYYWITGRVDDLMNVSGHLLSTAEIESALVAHPSVAEAAVVAAPDDIKGNVPYAFVTLKAGLQFTPELAKELMFKVRTTIGPLATPSAVQLAPGLPKTRSGKITRRILRKIAEGVQGVDLGDTSTLADENVIQQLWDGRRGVPRTG